MRIVQEKEDAKKLKKLEKEQRKKEKEQRKKEREMEKKQQQNKKQKKATKGGQTKSSTTKKNASSKDNLYKCPICKMEWKDDRDQDSEWLECDCKQWLHEQCIDYEIKDALTVLKINLVVPSCVTPVCTVQYA